MLALRQRLFPEPLDDLSRVSRTSSQVVVWLRMQSLSDNLFRSDVDDMNARSSQKTRASTFRLIFSRASSSRAVSLGRNFLV